MDRVGANFEGTVSEIRERLGANPVRIQLPIGSEDKFVGIVDLINMNAVVWNGEELGAKFTIESIPADMVDEAAMAREEMLDAATEHDDALMEAVLEGREIEPKLIIAALRKGCIKLALTPVLCGAAFKNKGVQPMLDAVVFFLPSPLDVPPIEGHDPKGNVVVRKASDDEKMAGLAFKIMTDPFVGQLTYIRVYSGVLKSGDTVMNVTKNKKERIGRLLLMHANKREEIKEIYCGNIAAAVGLKTCTTGDSLAPEGAPLLLEKMEFPNPVIQIAIEPKSVADEEKLGQSLAEVLLSKTRRSRVHTDPETGQTIISGMGELHLEIIVDRMRREFKVEANVGKPQVAYRETITASAEARGQYIRAKAGGKGSVR